MGRTYLSPELEAQVRLGLREMPCPSCGQPARISVCLNMGMLGVAAPRRGSHLRCVVIQTHWSPARGGRVRTLCQRGSNRVLWVRVRPARGQG